MPADEFFLGVYMTAAGPGELLTKITIPPGGQDGFAAVTIGRDGTGIVTAAASLNGGARDRDRLRRRGAGARDGRWRSGSARTSPTRACARRPKGSARRSIRRRDVHASADYRRHLAEVLAVRAVVGGEGAALMEPGHEQAHHASTVNGEEIEYDVEARRLLVHFLRDDLDLTGTHVGCDTGNCGACTVIYNGELAKSCMLLAIQADGATIETVEGLVAATAS